MGFTKGVAAVIDFTFVKKQTLKSVIFSKGYINVSDFTLNTTSASYHLIQRF